MILVVAAFYALALFTAGKLPGAVPLAPVEPAVRVVYFNTSARKDFSISQERRSALAL